MKPFKKGMDTYSSGMNPPARPKSNWGAAPMASPLMSLKSSAAGTPAPRKSKHESVMQPKDMSKGLDMNSPKYLGYAITRKSDKYRA